MKTNKELILEAIKGEAFLLEDKIGVYAHIDLCIDAANNIDTICICGVVTITDVEEGLAFDNRYSEAEQHHVKTFTTADWTFDGTIEVRNYNDKVIEEINYKDLIK